MKDFNKSRKRTNIFWFMWLCKYDLDVICLCWFCLKRKAHRLRQRHKRIVLMRWCSVACTAQRLKSHDACTTPVLTSDVVTELQQCVSITMTLALLLTKLLQLRNQCAGKKISYFAQIRRRSLLFLVFRDTKLVSRWDPRQLATGNCLCSFSELFSVFLRALMLQLVLDWCQVCSFFSGWICIDFCHRRTDVMTEIFYRRPGLARWQLVKNILIVLVGFLGFVAGTVVSIINIIYDLSHPNDEGICSGGIGPENTTTAPPMLTTTASHPFSTANSNFSHTLNF